MVNVLQTGGGVRVALSLYTYRTEHVWKLTPLLHNQIYVCRNEEEEAVSIFKHKLEHECFSHV